MKWQTGVEESLEKNWTKFNNFKDIITAQLQRQQSTAAKYDYSLT